MKSGAKLAFVQECGFHQEMVKALFYNLLLKQVLHLANFFHLTD